MTKPKQWLLLDPLDTLFFRDAQSMTAGESHEVHSFFPPMPSTLVGALRTAVLMQRKLDFQDFTKHDGPSQRITDDFPLLGTPKAAGFDVFGPLLVVKTTAGLLNWLFPAPANWLTESSLTLSKGCMERLVEIAVADRIPEEVGRRLGLCGTVSNPVWVTNPRATTLKSLTGFWANKAGLEKVAAGTHCLTLHGSTETVSLTEPALLPSNALVASETRVGIAMDASSRRVKKGHLYSATHARLKAEVSMAVGLSDALVTDYLDASGVLQLGGETRMVRYDRFIEEPVLPNGKSSWIMAVNSVPYSVLLEQRFEGLPRCSGSLIRMGGWDMQKGFHKDMCALLPPGTVIKVEDERPIPFGFIRI